MTDFFDEAISRFESGDPAEARRLFHGRGFFYPGQEHLVINWFPPYLQVINYQPAEHLLSKHDLIGFSEAIKSSQGLVLQSRAGRRINNEILCGQIPEKHVTQELGQRYWVRLLDNQNVGLFLDMGHVRAWLAPRVFGKKVLNLFSYTCAFSVSVQANGAKSIVNIDMSKNAIEWGKENHLLNNLDFRGVTMLPHNIFRSWWKIKQLGSYDVIIIDPPTNQRGSFNAEKNYGQILKRIPTFAEKGAVVVACLNSPFLGREFLINQMARWCPACRLIEDLGPHPDFPDAYPERGLKVLAFNYEG